MNITETAYLDILKPSEAVFEIAEVGTRPSIRSSITETGVIFLCVISGKLRAFGNTMEKYLTAGECLAADLTKGYRFLQDSEEPCKALYAVAKGRLVYDLMTLYSISDFLSVRAPEISEALNEIHQKTADPDLAHKEKQLDCMPPFLRMITKMHRASMLGGRNTQSTVAMIRNHIDAHLEDKLTLDELSKMFFVSKTQIFRMFKDTYGIAPMQYFLQKKIELAKQMLSGSDMHISEIAETLSFTDAKHFSKTFKKFSGELPRNYRREAKSEKLKKGDTSGKS